MVELRDNNKAQRNTSTHFHPSIHPYIKMPDPETNRGSLPAFAIVIAVILGIVVLVLAIFLFINRNSEGKLDLSLYTFVRTLLKIDSGSFTKLLHRRKPTIDSMRKIVYLPDESNPRRPLNAPPRAQPTAYNPPRPYPTGGPPRSSRSLEEAEHLLPTRASQAFVPRELELKPQTPYVSAGVRQYPAPPRGARPKAPTFGPTLYPTSIGAAGGYIR